MRNWSFEIVEREVRANLVYRMFTRVGAEKVPDAKTLGRIECALGPEIIQKVQGRMVGIAAEKKIVKGRKMRGDTTVTENNILRSALRKRHYVPFPTMSRGGGSESVFVRSDRQESKCAAFEYA